MSNTLDLTLNRRNEYGKSYQMTYIGQSATVEEEQTHEITVTNGSKEISIHSATMGSLENTKSKEMMPSLEVRVKSPLDRIEAIRLKALNIVHLSREASQANSF